ncbi:MAG: helix-turn-helix domain-containing GNAT family N-acetyltransferase [Acidobacteriaceae bacterium]
MTEIDETVQAVRRFSRFYTALMGTLDEGFLRTALSFPESRALYEISTSGHPAASAIAAGLRLDAGYVSRLLARLEERGLIRRRISSVDARQSAIFLTAAGRKEVAALDARSSQLVSEMLSPCSEEQRRKLVDAVTTIESILGVSASRDQHPFVLRTHRPGDMGMVVHRHGALYAQEYGWDERFEALVARITADFIDEYDRQCERCWIAERDGEFLGCVFLVKDRSAERTAKLRLLLVEPSARGLGLGRALVRQCTQFARQAGYERIVLWTNSVLTAARRIYEREGYNLVREEDHESFGRKLTGQYWELRL